MLSDIRYLSMPPVCGIPYHMMLSCTHTHTHAPTHTHTHAHIIIEPSERGEDDQEDHPSDAWLGAIARGTMETYVQSILLIPSLPPQAALQLATDIGRLRDLLRAYDTLNLWLAKDCIV